MKLSAKQAKTFVRLQQKYNVSVELMLQNLPAILKFIQFAITPHIVLKRKLIRKRNRVFLRHNCIRRLIFDPTQMKKNRISKRVHSQWSKRLVVHLKRTNIAEFVEDELPAEKAQVPEEVVSKQLKEQLELLKTGIRTVPLFQEVNTAKPSSNTRLSSAASLDEPSESEKGDNACVASNETEPSKPTTTTSPLPPPPPTPAPTVIYLDEDTKSSVGKANQDDTNKTKRLSSESDKTNSNFLDMLMSKAKITADEANETSVTSDKSMESPPPQKNIKTTALEVLTAEEQHENSNSSSDFFGFDDSERIPGTFPGMLSTPLVEKSDFNSPFESETLNAYMRDNSLESSSTVTFPQQRCDDGLAIANTIPPKLDMPALPEGLQGLRTVAERRVFLQKCKNIKYCIINNVGTIYRELQKRIKGHRINRHAIEAMQASNSAPITRQGWKVATWLITEEGNYYFQTIRIDGKDYRLFGSPGNNQTKFVRPHSNKCDKISNVCTNECIDRIIFRAFRPIRTIQRRSKLQDAAHKITYKACPLSQKRLYCSSDDEPSYDNLEIVRMPRVELEVFPQLQKPLNDIAKRYLQLILPFGGISREWAQFSVSTLMERQQKRALATNSHQSFSFPLPYANDRNHVLVRRVHSRCEIFDHDFDDSTLSFRKEIDQKKADGEPFDSLIEDCADVLTELLNSVAICCCENSFIKDDPDNIYPYGNDCDDEPTKTLEKSTKKTVEPHQHQAVGQSNRKQSRLMMELKRLNATIIDAAASTTKEDALPCDKEICKLGCVCGSLNVGTTIRHHCGKQRCILDCSCRCPGIMRLEAGCHTITTEDAFMLRRQATAKLARMEKEFTSTIVLTGSETLLINESQYDKKRRCTKIPKRYGDFVDPDETEFNDYKRTEPPPSANYPLEPIMVNEKIFRFLKHCSVKVKRLRDVNDLAPWCMIHMVYKCYCRGQAINGNPIVVEKQEEPIAGTIFDECPKFRSFYSFDKEETKATEYAAISSSAAIESSESDNSDSVSLAKLDSQKLEKKDGRTIDNDIINAYVNAKANHCRRVVPIPRLAYRRKNKQRVAHVQLYIAEHETDETRLSLNEHVLRSVYYHRNNPSVSKRSNVPPPPKINEKRHLLPEDKKEADRSKQHSVRTTNVSAKRKPSSAEQKRTEDVVVAKRKRQTSDVPAEEQSPHHSVKRSKYSNIPEIIPSIEIDCSPTPSPVPMSLTSIPVSEIQITVPKISQIFSLNTQAMEMGTDTAAAVAAAIPQQSTEAAACAGVSSEAFKNVFQVVIRNMNNLVSKKMQDIDMALRRESKTIPAPNDEILCIIRWNNFLDAFNDGFVYLWEVRTVHMTFIAATVKNLMPLVINALSVVNIRALPKQGLPLMGRMLIDRIRNGITDTLAVVMQGQKMFWFVKGFLRPDKTRICPKPNPETHPLLTRKINVLCRLLINQQINEHKKRLEKAAELIKPVQPVQPVHPVQPVQTVQPIQTVVPPLPILNSTIPQPSPVGHRQLFFLPQRALRKADCSMKVKLLPMQKNITPHANKILQQMVTQAYGMVRTNIIFRKLQDFEVDEIYQPASNTKDHHWLLIDVSNDFSHIFIPELKDLLTLDRIQKVVAYAVAKRRIVMMQFSPLVTYNAYVTPMSRRKLYFGPFESTDPTPQLILLQSVDGQMMLREVYEARHKVTAKTDKTTAFWLIQKHGKLYADVEIESGDSINDGLLISPNTVQEAETAKKPPLPVNDDDDDDCVIIEDDAPSVSAPQESNSPERSNFTILFQGDNSSLVVAAQTESGEPFPGVVQNVSRHSFTKLTPDAGSPIVTTDTETDSSQQQLPQEPIKPSGNSKLKRAKSIKIRDTMCSSTIALPTGITVSVPKFAVTTLPFSMASPAQPSEIMPASLPTHITVSTMPTTSTNNCPSLAGSFDQMPAAADLISSEPPDSEPMPMEDNRSIEKEKPPSIEPNLNVTKLPATMKWNKNLTVTKVPVDNDTNTSSTASVTTTNSPKMSPNPSSLVERNIPGMFLLKGQPVRPVMQTKVRPNATPATTKHYPMGFPAPQLVRNITPMSQQSVKTTTPTNTLASQIRIYPPNVQQRHVAKKVCPTSNLIIRTPTTVPRPMAPTHTGLTIRTPSAINTFVKSAQELRFNPKSTGGIPAGYSLLRPNYQPTRMRVPPGASLFPRPKLNNNSMRMGQPSMPKNPTHTLFLRSIPNPAFNATKSPSPVPMAQSKQGMTRVQLVPDGPIRAKIQKLFTRDQLPSTSTTSTIESPQIDPLHISEESSDIAQISLLQPKLPNDVKTVRITANPAQTKVSVTPLLPDAPSDASGGGGVKRSSMGTIVIRPTMRFPTTTTTQNTLVTATPKANSTTVVTLSTPTDPQTVQIKGIPIELPYMKKFSIASSSNTTVITPPTSDSPKVLTQEEVESSSSIITMASVEDSDQPKRQKILNPGCGTPPSSANNSPSLIPKSLNKVQSISSTDNVAALIDCVISSTPSSSTEYGYFHANIPGLPKFVVKRINDDFLIKVPNFNGILKLTGLATVHNYLNQYTTQKCGKTAEDIVNLKWYFKSQDRSKLNGINKSNSSLIKPSIFSPKSVKQLLAVQRTATQPDQVSVTLPVKPTNQASSSTKPVDSVVNELEAEDAIVLLDDE